jgi:HAD superfamily hydrolase (TIGR01509 family)
MNRITCFDLDGVSVQEHEPFSARLIKKQGSDIAPVVNEFFSHEFGHVMVGQKGIAESIEPYLERFHWEGDAKSLLDFWFDGEKVPVGDVLDIIKSIHDRGITTYLVTDNPKERVTAYWDEFLGQYFDGRYVSGETGLKKSSQKLWEFIAADTGVDVGDIFFTDDDEENVAIAKSAGVHALLFTTAAELQNQLNDFL